MKRLVGLVALVLLLGILFLSGFIDTSTPIADTSIADSEVTRSVIEANDSDSASATITITMFTSPDE